MLNILKFILDFFRPILVVLMWPLLIVNPILTLILQIIYKPVSYLMFTFVTSIFILIVLIFGFINNIYSIYHVFILTLNSLLGININVNIMFYIITSILSVISISSFYLLYKKNKFQFFK